MNHRSKEGSSKDAHHIIRSTTLTLSFQMDRSVAEALRRALLPEARSGFEDEVRVCLRRRGGVLTIKTDSPDLSNLRAAVNSYGHLVKVGADCASASRLL